MAWLSILATGRRDHAAEPPDPAMVDFYRQFVNPGDLVFDVGANVGNRTAIFLELGARVVAVEPQPACARLLRRTFGREPRFTLDERGLGSAPGKNYLYQGSVRTLSSMSRAWIDAVRRSGRFERYHWGRRQKVTVTTLDELIRKHGLPAFVKVDVEGYELEVVRGLSRPLPMLSLEFVPEALEPSFEAIQRLARLGLAEFNYGLGEATTLQLGDWVDAKGIVAELSRYRDRIDVFGDVYVRFDLPRGAAAAL